MCTAPGFVIIGVGKEVNTLDELLTFPSNNLGQFGDIAEKVSSSNRHVTTSQDYFSYIYLKQVK